MHSAKICSIQTFQLSSNDDTEALNSHDYIRKSLYMIVIGLWMLVQLYIYGDLGECIGRNAVER